MAVFLEETEGERGAPEWAPGHCIRTSSSCCSWKYDGINGLKSIVRLQFPLCLLFSWQVSKHKGSSWLYHPVSDFQTLPASSYH